MVAVARHHELRWMAPHPMWTAAGIGLNGAPARPAILRFATDAFMDELMALVATRPEALPAWLAVPETWREPAPKPPAEGLSPARPLSFARARATRLARARGLLGGAQGKPVPVAATDLKLYQPAQDRFYLVAAQLVCARPGLPDRRIEAGKQERARFVIRRLAPPAGAGPDFEPGSEGVEEYAFVPRAEGGWWRRLDSVERTRLHPDEERLGLFPSAYDTAGRRRRLLLGAVPVARRETYAGAPLSEADGTPPPAADPDGPSPLGLLFRTEVTEPWRALVQQAAIVNQATGEGSLGEPSPDEADEADADLDEIREAFLSRTQTAAWFILADAARFLETHLPEVWAELKGLSPTRPLTDAEEALVEEIRSLGTTSTLAGDIESLYAPDYDEEVFHNFADALARLTSADADQIEQADVEFDIGDETSRAAWPGFLWLAAYPGESPEAAHLDALDQALEAALPETPAGPVPDLAPPAAAARDEEPWFTIRCVFERPNCEGFARPVVSAPSVPFRMASFFDPDAPTRAIRIPMPLDISPAGLRKYKKGAGFVLSNMLCGQFERFKGVTLGDLVRSVLPWPLHKDLPADSGPCGGSGAAAFGRFVSISIPIVTICAFIVMIIMVKLLDLVFRWMPYLMVTFRIPGLKGKSG